MRARAGGFFFKEGEIEAEGAVNGKKKEVSQRTTGYTGKEDLVLCQAWPQTSQDHICAPSKKAMCIGGRSPKIFVSPYYMLLAEFIVRSANFQSNRGGSTSNKRLTSFVSLSIPSYRAV
jgi:hypothetical protein